MAKRSGSWITLGIGDGANDVSMIQEAHIGVGIAGKEGTQAMQASDYAFGQFRFLEKLVLVHGRWGYRRITFFICYYFYKNIMLVFTELWFSMYNGFSGQIFFLDWLSLLFNAFWTSFPCIFTYAFEQDLSAAQSLENPVAYGAGQKGVYFGFKRFWTWIVLALFHGTICYWVPMMSFGDIDDSDGETKGFWWTSTLSFTLVIHVVVIKLFIESVYWNKISIFVALFSLAFYYCT